MSLVDRIVVTKGFNFLVGRRSFTRLVGWFTDGHIPGFLLKPLIRKFIRKFDIDMSICEFDIEGCRRFNDFFARKLKPGARVFYGDVASPVEGYMSFHGMLETGRMLQVKGREFTLEQLVGHDDSKYYKDGSYATIYLSPADYHRIHAPFDMVIESVTYLPGTLFSVGKDTLQLVDGVYCRNERIVLKGTSKFGSFFFVMVGAMIVGKVKLSFDAMTTNRRRQPRIDKVFDSPVRIAKGEELGYFEMGSTVVMTLDKPLFYGIKKGVDEKVILGEKLIEIQSK